MTENEIRLSCRFYAQDFLGNFDLMPFAIFIIPYRFKLETGIKSDSPFKKMIEISDIDSFRYLYPDIFINDKIDNAKQQKIFNNNNSVYRYRLYHRMCSPRETTIANFCDEATEYFKRHFNIEDVEILIPKKWKKQFKEKLKTMP